MKVWDRAGIELATPGSAVREASVVLSFVNYIACSTFIIINLWYITEYDDIDAELVV